MIPLNAPFRLANPSDAAALADLVNFAGEGLPLYIWQGLAADGQDPWELGRERQAEKTAEGQIVVIDEGAGAIAGLTGYVIGTEPEEISPDFPALFRPLQELENEALNSWYVNVLAAYTHHRNRGLGSRLLELAEAIAVSVDQSQMSLIVADNNVGARRLYERHGYIQTASRACVKDDWETEANEWVLLEKSL